MGPPLHPNVEPLRTLLGTWSGAGRGEYPTIEPFEYAETVEFSHVGKAFLAYTQRTKDPHDHRPLHAETGYLRMPQPGLLEAVIAHPTGITEVLEGTATASGHLSLRLRTHTVARTATAKEVVTVERDLTVEGDVLTYEVRMAAVGQPLTHHLAAALHRQGPDQ